MNGEISGSATVVTAKEQLWCDLAGEAAILNLKNDVDPDRCEQDLLALLHKPAAEGLIVVKNEAGP